MSVDELCANFTFMNVRSFVMDDAEGRTVVLVIAKLAWSISDGGVVTIAPEPRPIRLHDERTTNDWWSSLRFPSDLVDAKPGTDVLLLGTAYPPRHRTVKAMDVGLRIRARTFTIAKMLRVYGLRVWQKALRGVAPGPSVPLRPTPLCYELAFGGRDESIAGAPLVDWANPAGGGVARDPKHLVDQRAPQIEDPYAPSTPAGFGPVAPEWLPRRHFAGTYDAAWRRKRAPVRPVDFDPRHNNCAAPGLWSEVPLEGDEPVSVLGATPGGLWQFQLPRYVPAFRYTVGGRTHALRTHLDTYLIDADARIVELTWRASVPCSRKLEKIERIRVITGDVVPGECWPRESRPLAHNARVHPPTKRTRTGGQARLRRVL